MFIPLVAVKVVCSLLGACFMATSGYAIGKEESVEFVAVVICLLTGLALIFLPLGLK